MTYGVTRTIRAPAATIWDLLSDADTYRDWNPAVVSIEGPIEQHRSIKLVSVVDPRTRADRSLRSCSFRSCPPY